MARTKSQLKNKSSTSYVQNNITSQTLKWNLQGERTEDSLRTFGGRDTYAAPETWFEAEKMARVG